MAELTGPARGFDNARRDLDVIAERIEVVFLEGWWPAQPDHDRPSPATPSAGSRYDVGQGSYRARQSWRALVDHLAAADVGSGAVLAQLAGSGPYSGPGRPRTFEAVRSSVAMVRARLAGLERLWDAMERGELRTRTADQLFGKPGREHGSPCWHIEHARFAVLAIVAIVGNGKRPPLCGRCHKMGTVGDPRRKGWCAACYRQWFRESATNKAPEKISLTP